ncbi:MAG TPA: mannitol dehydrogenase family protein [Gaiellaceae bacterium]
MTISLTQNNLDAIAALGVPVPRYDRRAVSPRILHVGVGGFHRAHMARYTDDVAASGGGWGICGVGLLDADRRMADALGQQDGLYTLVERDNDGSMPRVVGSIVEYGLVVGNEAEFSRRVADPEIAILSMTITEGGYSLAGGNSTIETIVSGLDARLAAGGRPITILSCDNLPDSGAVTRHAIATVAAARSADLLRYVEQSCTFPTSMVDRITPQTRDEDVRWLRDDVGIDDAWPVVCESFRQWVVEDDFAAGRPAWEDVGVLFTDRVHDWELYKLRMLNASHSCMAYLAALAGVEFVDEAIAIPALRQYLERFLSTEAIPTLVEIPGHPARDYAETVFRRFENGNVRDQIARLCIDGTSKFPSFLIPTIDAQLERGGPVDCAALALAGWARYLATVPAAERAPDPHADEAAAAAEDPAAFLELDLVFTPSIRENERFRETFFAATRELAERGALTAMQNLGEPQIA